MKERPKPDDPNNDRPADRDSTYDEGARWLGCWHAPSACLLLLTAAVYWRYQGVVGVGVGEGVGVDVLVGVAVDVGVDVPVGVGAAVGVGGARSLITRGR